jgi:hypothetical protein
MSNLLNFVFSINTTEDATEIERTNKSPLISYSYFSTVTLFHFFKRNICILIVLYRSFFVHQSHCGRQLPKLSPIPTSCCFCNSISSSALYLGGSVLLTACGGSDVMSLLRLGYKDCIFHVGHMCSFFLS